ncbi:MAG: DUF167 domain-containing protein [Phycisphaerae bacterium]
MKCVKAVGNGVEILIKAVPGASRDRIVGPLGDAIKIQVSAAPERGKANAAIEKLLAAALGVSPRDVAVTKGHGHPRKTVSVRDVTAANVRAKLGLSG